MKILSIQTTVLDWKKNYIIANFTLINFFRTFFCKSTSSDFIVGVSKKDFAMSKKSIGKY